MIIASKYHSYGNDYLVLQESALTRERAAELTRAMCRPHFGIGADGCVFIEAREVDCFGIRIFNKDGSEASMSGNGSRCASAFVHHREWSKENRLRLETRSGVKVHNLLDRKDLSWNYRSSLGKPSFVPKEIPIRLEQDLSLVVGYSLIVGGNPIKITALSVGNPQCVVFVSTLPQESEFQRLGSALEMHPFFPDRTNVSFVQVVEPRLLNVRIWERGVGPTHSSGTGCTGAAVAAIYTGSACSPVLVRTETGQQEVEWQPGEEVLLTGQVEFIAHVYYNWREDEGG